MSLSLLYADLIALIELVGVVLVAGYVAVALVSLLRGQGITRARLLVAEGVLWGLSFKLASTLLKTMLIHTWEQIGLLVAILALRTLVKWVFTWETERLQLRVLSR